MSMGANIGPRGRAILTAIVETYISTGEPVGSKTISQAGAEQWSAATIRNVMAELADAGYLDQPHTSAGRVPTADAYRYYVEQLTGKTRMSEEEEGKIESMLAGANDVQEFMERTSRVLSLVSSSVGVAIASTGSRNSLEHVHFSRLGDHRILAVVVTKSGLVRDRVLRLQHDMEQGDLEIAARYINENFRGWNMEDLRSELQRRIESERNEYDRLMKSVEHLYREGALTEDATPPMVYLEGAANLVQREEDKERLAQLLKTLEEKGKIADLVAAYLDARQEAVRVVIGLEDVAPHLKNLVLIGAPARANGEVVGSFAVLGPQRMDYQHTITAVSHIARLFDHILNEGDEGR
ncbi:MAG: heat-inducible transcriptional repressor HrcA [Terriglobales bacterium]|jgi:heat-inducible transcriptional repressor